MYRCSMNRRIVPPTIPEGWSALLGNDCALPGPSRRSTARAVASQGYRAMLHADMPGIRVRFSTEGSGCRFNHCRPVFIKSGHFYLVGCRDPSRQDHCHGLLNAHLSVEDLVDREDGDPSGVGCGGSRDVHDAHANIIFAGGY